MYQSFHFRVCGAVHAPGCRPRSGLRQKPCCGSICCLPGHLPIGQVDGIAAGAAEDEVSRAFARQQKILHFRWLSANDGTYSCVAPRLTPPEAGTTVEADCTRIVADGWGEAFRRHLSSRAPSVLPPSPRRAPVPRAPARGGLRQPFSQLRQPLSQDRHCAVTDCVKQRLLPQLRHWFSDPMESG